MKRGRVPASAVSAVYIVLQRHQGSSKTQSIEAHLSEKLLNPAQIALLRGVEQGGVASEEVNNVLVSLLDIGV